MKGIQALFVAAGMFVVSILAPSVCADTILAVPTGYQLLSSDAGTAVKLSAPAGAFGQQSNALSDALSNVIIDSAGVGGSSPGPQSPFEFDVPLEATGINFGRVILDYIKQEPSTVMKIQGWTLPKIGSTAQAPVDMVSLSLRSISPLQVTYGNGVSSSFFDVFVELLPPAQSGTLDLTRTDNFSGTYNLSIPIAYQMTFVNTSPGGPQANGPLVFADILASSGDFSVVPEPASVLLLSIAIAGFVLGAIKSRRRKLRSSIIRFYSQGSFIRHDHGKPTSTAF
jgi:hypothetical protein